jgi:hypothetical protein
VDIVIPARLRDPHPPRSFTGRTASRFDSRVKILLCPIAILPVQSDANLGVRQTRSSSLEARPRQPKIGRRGSNAALPSSRGRRPLLADA